MTRYINIFTCKYRQCQEDFIRWCTYDSLKEAREKIAYECPSNYCFKKTIIIEVDEGYDGDHNLDDDIFESIFPNTRHCDSGYVYYDIPND